MWLFKQLTQWVIEKVFIAYYKIFGYAGILFFLLIVECIFLMIYRDDVLGIVDISGSPVIIADAVPISVQDDIVEYELVLENDGSTENHIFSIETEDGEGNYISNDVVNVYQDAENWANVGRGDMICIPPGSQAKVTVKFEKIFLESAESEKLIFRIGLPGEEASFETELP